MALELAQIVAELVQAVGSGGEVEACEDGVVDLLGGPAANLSAAMQEDFEEADETRIVDLDPWIANRADGDRESKALEQREVDMNIEPLCLEGSKAASDGLEAVADRVEMIQSLLEVEIGEIVGDQLVAQEGRELFVLLQEGVFEVGAEDMMAVLDAIDDGGEFALHPTAHTHAEDLADLVRRQPPQAELAAAFKQLVDREVTLENEVAPVSWTPDYLGSRSPRWARQEQPTHLSSAARWLSWCAPAGRRRSWRASSNRRHSRSGTGWHSLSVTPAGATAA